MSDERDCTNCGAKTTRSIIGNEPYCEKCTNAFMRGRNVGEAEAVQRVAKHFGHSLEDVRAAVKKA